MNERGWLPMTVALGQVHGRQKGGWQKKFPVVGQVRDVDDVLWYVRDVRPTKHGFDLLFGSEVSRIASTYCGLPKLIATRPLVDFWETHRIKHTGVLFDLPAGRTTLKRLRNRLGFNYLENVSEFWQERIEDLGTMGVREFAAKHDVPACAVFGMRTKLLGVRKRPIGWWRKPGPLSVLLSKATLREMGERLDISTSQAHRLKVNAHAEYGEPRWEWEKAA